MKRDASPKRTPKLGGFRPCCSVTIQQWLLYFALALDCDTPILEALIFPTMPLLGLSPNAPFNLLFDTILRRFVYLFPCWILKFREPEATYATFINLNLHQDSHSVSIESNVYKMNDEWRVSVEISRNGSRWASIRLNDGSFEIQFTAIVTPLRFAHFEAQIDLLLTIIGNTQNYEGLHFMFQKYNIDMATLLSEHTVSNSYWTRVTK